MSRCRLHAKILYLIIDDRFFVCQFLPMCGLRDCRFGVVVATQLRADDVATAAVQDRRCDSRLPTSPAVTLELRRCLIGFGRSRYEPNSLAARAAILKSGRAADAAYVRRLRNRRNVPVAIAAKASRSDDSYRRPS